MTKKIMTSVKIPSSLEKSILERVVAEGYKLHGKSKWVVEAIESFLKMPNYHELVDIAGTLEKLDTIVSIRLSEELLIKLDEALVQVRIKHPEMEGVRSNIIRASILQRLLKTHR